MKLFGLVTPSIVYFLFSMSLLVAQDQAEPNGEVDLKEWNAARHNWYRISEDQTSESSDVRSAYKAIQSAWDTLPPYWKKDTSPAGSQARIRAAVTAAELFASAGDTGEAVAALRDGAKLAQELGVAFAQGRTDNTFRSRASVHARLFAETGSDPLLGLDIGYDIWKQGNGYAALQEGQFWENQYALVSNYAELISSAETEGRMVLQDSKGRITQELSVAISKGSGSPKSRLSAILKHESAHPESAGRFLRQEPEIYFASAAISPTTPTMAPTSSNTSQATRQEKVPSTSTAPSPQEKAASSTPWSIIVVLIAAATGLLWLLVMKRQ